nr:uncharacterized protein LOC109181758 isoform X2 [Ipomoea batatas]
MAARYGFGGKASVDEDDMKGQPAITAGRYVLGGGYKGKGRNNLRDTLDKFGKVKDFLNHDHTEMVVPTNLSRPDKAEDSSKKPNNKNFCQDHDDVDDSIVPNNLGPNPYPNNNVIKPTNNRGTAMDPPKDDKQSYGVNNTPSNKMKKQNMEMGGLNSKASITQDSPPMHRTNGFPNMNWQDQDDESKKNNIRPTPRTLVSNKPNMSNGWQDYNYYDDTPLKPQGRYNYNNRAHRWKEITPNPPPQLRYGGAYPNLRPVYRRPVIDSKWAEKKYNGVLLTDN